jgi:hypothetical protein
LPCQIPRCIHYVGNKGLRIKGRERPNEYHELRCGYECYLEDAQNIDSEEEQEEKYASLNFFQKKDLIHWETRRKEEPDEFDENWKECTHPFWKYENFTDGNPRAVWRKTK